jgi:hypothetical protein
VLAAAGGACPVVVAVAGKHVELTEDIPNLDHSTIGRVLKKRNCGLI